MTLIFKGRRTWNNVLLFLKILTDKKIIVQSTQKQMLWDTLHSDPFSLMTEVWREYSHPGPCDIMAKHQKLHQPMKNVFH